MWTGFISLAPSYEPRMPNVVEPVSGPRQGHATACLLYSREEKTDPCLFGPLGLHFARPARNDSLVLVTTSTTLYAFGYLLRCCKKSE